MQIRFTRLGRKKLPFYRIIAIDSKKRREGEPLEVGGAHVSRLPQTDACWKWASAWAKFGLHWRCSAA